MANLAPVPCCGVAEIVHLSRYTEPQKLIKSAKAQRKGMLIANFVKCREVSGVNTWTRERWVRRGDKDFRGRKLMDALERHGFRKLKRFVNPNTGNTIQPMVYFLKKEERAEVRR